MIHSARGLLALTAAVVLVPVANAAAFTERVSLTSGGAQPLMDSRSPSVSADGRYVAFVSEDDGMVPGEGPFSDIFVRDRVARTTILVSRTDSGGPSDGSSFLPSISADGRYVAFASRASNLAAGDTDAFTDVFVRDLATGSTTLVSAAAPGQEPDSGSTEPSISADGRHVAFKSFSSNLVAGDTNGRDDIFVRDLVPRTTERVSVSSSGEQATRNSSTPAIDATGRVVAFLSHAPNLVPGDTTSPPGTGEPSNSGDVFVRDRSTGQTRRVSVSSGGAEADADSHSPSISPDGRFIAFKSYASNLVVNDTNRVGDVFLHDRASGTTERVDVSSGEAEANADTFSGPTSVGAEGRFVAFASTATNLAARPTTGFQMFRRDRQLGTTTLMSVGTTWQPDDGGAFGVDMTPDGRLVAFDSFGKNLVWRDTNFGGDVFVHIDAPAPRRTCDELPATIVGTNGNDEIAGTPGADVIVGRGGSDTIKGGGGNDTICGDGGLDDRRTSDDGADVLEGGDGADVLIGQGGADTLKGSAGGDALVGGVGDDVMSGSIGDDRLFGNAGTDTLSGGTGHDWLSGDSGADALDGQSGQDSVLGGSGPDRLKGGADPDRLVGAHGDDRLTGADGDDALAGDAGLDMVAGGTGNDQLFGGTADDRLYGDDGNDDIDGGTHAAGDLCRQGPGAGTQRHCEL